MAIPTSKDELLAAIEKTFTQLSGDLDRVPPDAARQPVLKGHVKDTMMSPADLVAYLVGWNQQVLTWHRRRAAGLPDEFPAPESGGTISAFSPSATTPNITTTTGTAYAPNSSRRRT